MEGFTMITTYFQRGVTILGSLVLFLLLATTSLLAAPEKFSPGDLFVSLSNGKVQWLHADGAVVKTLDTGNAGQAKGMAFDVNGNLYVTHWYSPDLITGNNAEIFNADGIFLG